MQRHRPTHVLNRNLVIMSKQEIFLGREAIQISQCGFGDWDVATVASMVQKKPKTMEFCK